MHFLIILLCLLANYLWLKDFDRFDDGWFFRFRQRIEALTGPLSGSSRSGWFVAVLFVYLLPILLLWGLLWFVAGRALGIPTMLLHLLVLLVALDRIQPGKMAADFLAHWRRGDESAARSYLEALHSQGEEALIDDDLPRSFARLLLYRAFERMFVMFFWYLLGGPVAVLFAYISYQLRDSHGADHPAAQVAFVSNMIAVLEWLPLRLLMLTFSLAGNFVQCFDNMKGSMWDVSGAVHHADLLYSSAGCALSGLIEKASPTGQEERANASNEENKIRALQSLLERSQAIWLIALAVATVYGL